MTALDELFRLTPIQKKSLERLRIATAADLLRHLPSRYEAAGDFKTIATLASGDEAVIHGKVIKTKASKGWKTKMPLGEAVIEDHTGVIKAVWFRQAYMAKKVPTGCWAKLRGKVQQRKEEIYLANPDIEPIDESQAGEHLFSHGGANNNPLVPVYPETRGLSSIWFYYHIQEVIKRGAHEEIADPIPADILKKYNLPTLKTALVWIHSPRKAGDAEAARKRFAFEEVFLIQLRRLLDRAAYQANPSYQISSDKTRVESFLARFPFKPTGAQLRAIKEIQADFNLDKPMTRLLEGDVGSGKTLVAAATAFAVVSSGLEVAYMVPTEILARQHFESFIKYFEHLNVQVGLLTGSECLKFPSKVNPKEATHISRPQLLKWVADGHIPILIGTHTLIQKAVKFRDLAYVIIDEQHRFGVMQRAKLVRKPARPDGRSGGESKAVPHLLSMTATPIPRTLALTIFGDLDLTLLDEMPAGRKPIITEVVAPNDRVKIYEKVRQELRAGRQAYVICPRIEEPDPTKELALQAKSAKSERDHLKKTIFPEYEIGLLHSKLKPSDKETVMADFQNGKINILVATSVVEVGVNVPNATVIIIEGAERFGLAQLHQLRGRVIRSEHQAYCYLFTDSKTKTAQDRLKALATAKNGFELAEKDLALRGAGLLSGEKQWGISDIGMEAIKNLKMVEAARAEAQTILKEDTSLKKYPLLQTYLSTRTSIDHFE